MGEEWFGCLDPQAVNYNPTARLSPPDSSNGEAGCTMPPPCWTTLPSLGWRNMSADAQVLEQLTQDDGVAEDVPLPFSFPFFGASYSFVDVAANGFLRFKGFNQSV